VDFKLESMGFNEEPENEARVQAMLLKHNAEIIDQ
jgi:hypothetical protein